MGHGGDIINNNTEFLQTKFASSSQRDTKYQVSAVQTPVTLFSAQTPSRSTAVSSGSLLSPKTLPPASPHVSSVPSLTSTAPLPQSYKCLRESGNKNNVNHNSNMSNCF